MFSKELAGPSEQPAGSYWRFHQLILLSTPTQQSTVQSSDGAKGWVLVQYQKLKLALFIELFAAAALSSTVSPSAASILPAAARRQHRKLQTYGARFPPRRPEKQPCSVLTLFRYLNLQKIIVPALSNCSVISCAVFCLSVSIYTLNSLYSTLWHNKAGDRFLLALIPLNKRTDNHLP